MIAAPAPGCDAVLKICKILDVAADDKCPQAVQCSDAIVARLRTYQRPAISLNKVNPPAAITVVEIHQDAAHDGIVGLEPEVFLQQR